MIKKILLLAIFMYSLAFSSEKGDVITFNQFYEQAPDVAACEEGYINETEKQKVLDLVNQIRARHNLLPIYYNDEYDLEASESSLMMAKNKSLSHQPPSSWDCYTEEGYDGAEHSNLYISSSSGTNYPTTESSIIAWMIDNFSERVGHRRWIIDPFLEFMALGRADWNDGSMNYTAMSQYVISDQKQDITNWDMDFVAYPYHNYKPEWVYYNGGDYHYLSFTAIFDKQNYWNNQNVDYTDASVTMQDENGNNISITQTFFDNQGYGVPNCLKWKPSSLNPEMKYNVTITNVIINGQAREYSYWFRLTNVDQTTPPEVPTLVSPANGSQGNATDAGLEWAQADRATSYNAQLSSDANFINIILDETTSARMVSFSDLEDKTEYFWRVKSINDAGKSDWSDVWSFTTRGGLPQKVTLISPNNESEDVKFPFQLEWAADENAESYALQVADQSDFGGFSVIISESSLSETDFQIESTDLETNTTYYWRIKANSTGGDSPWSETWSFTTEPGTSVLNFVTENQIKVYPNPASNYISLDFRIQNGENNHLEIYNAIGNKVKSFRLTPEKLQNIDINDLHSGKYFFVIRSGDESHSGSFVISN